MRTGIDLKAVETETGYAVDASLKCARLLPLLAIAFELTVREGHLDGDE